MSEEPRRFKPVGDGQNYWMSNGVSISEYTTTESWWPLQWDKLQ